MSKNQGWLKTLIFGQPKPNPTQKTLQQIQKKLDVLQKKLDAQQLSPVQETNGQDKSEELAEQVRKLAKTQFKTNTLQEKQLAQQEETLSSLQRSLERYEKQLSEVRQQQQRATQEAELELVTNLLPVLDGLDAAFSSGKRLVLRMPMPIETRRAAIAWLDGVRLARIRLLELLQAHKVAPIPTVGHPFDPHRHVAVATDTSGDVPDGTIVGEDRRGYATSDKVLRYAEVVVSKKNT